MGRSGHGGRGARDRREEPRPGALWVLGRGGARDPAEGEAPAPPRRRERPPRPPAVAILGRGPGWIAAAKPSGVATVRERWFPEAPTALSLVHALLLREDPAAPLPHPVHRLDKETSGVVLFATDAPTAAALSRAFRRRRMHKEYLALVVGEPPSAEGEVDLRLQRERRPPGLVRVVRHGGRPSRTAWTTEERFSGWTLLRVFPRSGRTHQVRATLAHLGCPIVGDAGYGGGEGLYLSALKPAYRPPRDHPERPLVGRVALHALRLATGQEEGAPAAPGPDLDVRCALPGDMDVGLLNLRRFRPAAAAPGAPFPPGDR